MNCTVEYGSEDARMHVSHVTERDPGMPLRLPIDKNRDGLEWVCVRLTEPVSLS